MTVPRPLRLRRPALVPLGFAALLVAEIAAVVVVGRRVGVLLTVLLLLLGSIVGGWLLRREGARAWRAFSAAVAEGRPPHREAADGVLVLLGGLLVLFPGFVSDALGLLCLLPPTRRVLRGLVGRWAARRAESIRVVRVRARRGGPVDPGAARPPTGGRVIEGELDRPAQRSDPAPDSGPTPDSDPGPDSGSAPDSGPTPHSGPDRSRPAEPPDPAP